MMHRETRVGRLGRGIETWSGVFLMASGYTIRHGARIHENPHEKKGQVGLASRGSERGAGMGDDKDRRISRARGAGKAIGMEQGKSQGKSQLGTGWQKWKC